MPAYYQVFIKRNVFIEVRVNAEGLTLRVLLLFFLFILFFLFLPFVMTKGSRAPFARGAKEAVEAFDDG